MVGPVPDKDKLMFHLANGRKEMTLAADKKDCSEWINALTEIANSKKPKEEGGTSRICDPVSINLFAGDMSMSEKDGVTSSVSEPINFERKTSAGTCVLLSSSFSLLPLPHHFFTLFRGKPPTKSASSPTSRSVNAVMSSANSGPGGSPTSSAKKKDSKSYTVGKTLKRKKTTKDHLGNKNSEKEGAKDFMRNFLTIFLDEEEVEAAKKARENKTKFKGLSMQQVRAKQLQEDAKRLLER